MLAFWMGGAADPGGEAPPAAPTGLKHYPHKRQYVDLSRRPKQFGRKLWDELKAAQACQDALEKRAEAEKRETERQALLQAASEAQEAIYAAREAGSGNAEIERQFSRMVMAMQAAVGAKSVADVLSSTDAVVAAAQAAQAEIEDEEEAITLLLM